jgi:hypothetical protein
MANQTVCQTPGAQFHIHVSEGFVDCKVDLPEPLKLTEEEAKLLETNLHNALELVLARYFKQRKVEKTEEIS